MSEQSSLSDVPAETDHLCVSGMFGKIIPSEFQRYGACKQGLKRYMVLRENLQKFTEALGIFTWYGKVSKFLRVTFIEIAV